MGELYRGCILIYIVKFYLDTLSPPTHTHTGFPASQHCTVLLCPPLGECVWDSRTLSQDSSKHAGLAKPSGLVYQMGPGQQRPVKRL